MQVEAHDRVRISAERVAHPSFGLAEFIRKLLGGRVPIRIECYDGSAVGPPESRTRVFVSAEAPGYIASAPGELGLARAYVAGAIEIDGDIFDVLELRTLGRDLRLRPHHLNDALGSIGWRSLRPRPAPPEEARLHGRRHGKARDAAAIEHHYDVSNEFYRLLLGPSMTYSCAYFETPSTPLEDAQTAKYDLVCRKLGLQRGMRLLDVGCGWGGMAIHAARHYGVDVVGVTISKRQAEYAQQAARNAGITNRVEFRLQDYRDIADGPYDAISSIGMFEHVGLSQLDTYFSGLYALLRSEGRLLNHGIARASGRSRMSNRNFIQRYVFPDGELHQIGTVVSRLQRAGFEIRHVQSLREHYQRTLHEWVANLERHWDDAVKEVGVRRARVWRLYMAAAACLFGDAKIEVHQVLAVRDSPSGESGLGLTSKW